MMIVAVHDACPTIGISILPLLISLMVESAGRKALLVESTVNEKGSMPSYFCPVILSVMFIVSEAVLPTVSGDHATREMLIVC